MKVILAKKLEMTQKFSDDGTVTPVTVVSAGPCLVTQVKTEEKDGYQAVQVGFGNKKKLNKPLSGHLKDLENFAYLSEFLVKKDDKLGEVKRGDKITVDIFNKGEVVAVTGVSKGKGFQGVVRRHGFSGAPASHGHKDQQRMPGSIGATGPAHVFKGKKMPGQMGDNQTTISNLEIIDINKDENLLFIKGAVPGCRNGFLMIKVTKEIADTEQEVKQEAKQEEEKEKKS